MTCKSKNVDNSNQFDLLAYLCYVLPLLSYLLSISASSYKKINDVNALLNATEIVLILT